MIKKAIFDSEKNKVMHIIITLIYVVFNVFIILNHEAWRDESQAWVLAKNLSITELLSILCTEGHPCLWFFFLMPFAKLGLPFEYASFLSLIVMSITVYIYLESAPFSLIVKIGTLFSSMFLFYNPVVCRIYCLIALITVLLAKYFKERTSKPILYGILIALLFQTHVLAFGLAIGLTIVLVIDFLKDKSNKKILFSICLDVFSLIAAIIEIMPRSSNPTGVDTSISGILSKLNINTICEGMSYFAYTAWGWMNRSTSYIPYIFFFIFVVLIIAFISINKAWKQNYQIIISAICGCGLLFGVVCLIYKPHTQMASILMMILIFVMWVLYENNKSLNIRIVIICLLAEMSFLTFAVSQSLLRQDLSGNFSMSKETAQYILDNVNGDDVVIVENCVYDTPVYSYASKKSNIEFYDIRNQFDFVFYQAFSDSLNDKLSLNYIIDTALSNLKNKDTLYYLTINKATDSRLKLVYSNEDISNVNSENYYIYIICE